MTRPDEWERCKGCGAQMPGTSPSPSWDIYCGKCGQQAVDAAIAALKGEGEAAGTASPSLLGPVSGTRSCLDGSNHTTTEPSQ